MEENKLTHLISGLIATVITLPFIALFIIYFISFKLTKNKKKSFQHTVDFSTILFIISVYTLSYVIWEKSFLWLMILFFIVVAMILVFLQWKITEDIKLKRLLKGFWRFNFLFFFLGYFGLIFYGLYVRIVSI